MVETFGRIIPSDITEIKLASAGKFGLMRKVGLGRISRVLAAGTGRTERGSRPERGHELVHHGAQ